MIFIKCVLGSALTFEVYDHQTLSPTRRVCTDLLVCVVNCLSSVSRAGVFSVSVPVVYWHWA